MRPLRYALALILLASPASAIDVLKGVGDREGPQLDSLSRVVLRFEGGPIYPDALVLDPYGAALRYDLRQMVEQRNENRIDLGGLPVIGGVFQPTLRAEFAAETPAVVGAVYRRGATLFVAGPEGRPSAALTDGVARVVVAHRDVSFRFGRERRAGGAGAPPADLANATRVGEARRAGDALILLIPPTVVVLD